MNLKEFAYNFLYKDDNILTRIYNKILVFSILISIIPLMFKEQNLFFIIIDIYIILIFSLDYILHLISAEKLLDKGKKSAFLYAKTPMAIVDLISILSSVSILFNSVHFFRILKLLRTLRFLRFIKLFKYSTGINMILNIFKKQKDALLIVLNVTLTYIFLSALIMFTVEPEIFASFLDAVYWSIISITTIGYGDIVPKTDIGKLITMLSSLIGVMIIALPSAIFTAGYMDSINSKDK